MGNRMMDDTIQRAGALLAHCLNLLDEQWSPST